MFYVFFGGGNVLVDEFELDSSTFFLIVVHKLSSETKKEKEIGVGRMYGRNQSNVRQTDGRTRLTYVCSYDVHAS